MAIGLTNFKHIRSKKLAALVTVCTVATATTAGYAYWTTTGTATDTAAAAAGTGSLTLTADVAAGITPGGTAAVTGTITNPNSYSVNVTKVRATSITTTNAYHVTTNPEGCRAGDFSFADVAVGATIAGGGNQAYSGSLAMSDAAYNQDGCKNVTITVALEAL